jgi:hypothetical protein
MEARITSLHFTIVTNWGQGGTILNEIKLVGARSLGNGNVNSYCLESFNFKMGSSGKVLFCVGLWGVDKDAWIQIDDAAITCRTPF